ncbi:PREDICTED: coiled-coil and C2 domain-containing protein 2A-like [Chrysochloris asiatica]|uniref:Coiled-coil and C2 domain-containing protein 2A-like n=1 Tax=Chrysochloris asiatica TaxID=185453 RepID=A0A9B0T5C6_CHRAS|nr:PREDICTED: coiled-coil and C2 domain-containing protein 2A-like [Chrysochloris asiatica]
MKEVIGRRCLAQGCYRAPRPRSQLRASVGAPWPRPLSVAGLSRRRRLPPLGSANTHTHPLRIQLGFFFTFTGEAWGSHDPVSEKTDNFAVEEIVDKHLQKDLAGEENQNIKETLRGKVREKLKNAKINQGEKSSSQLFIDPKLYQWSKVNQQTEVSVDEGISFFVLNGDECSDGQALEQSLAQKSINDHYQRHVSPGDNLQNFAESQDESFFAEVIDSDLLEVKAAEYEDDQEQMKKQANIFVPSSSPGTVLLKNSVVNQYKLPKDMIPRLLEDEGFYIQKKTEIYRRMSNKMENRLLKLEEAVKSDLESSIRNKIEGQRDVYQLDLNIVGLQFSHHPLFNQEQVLCARLLQLYECFQNRQQQNLPQLLYEKLKALTDATKLANETNPLTKKSFQDYYWQISNTKQLYDLEKEKDFSLLHSMLRTWKQIKSLREQQGFTSTPVKLQFQRMKMNKYDEQNQEGLSKMSEPKGKTKGKRYKNGEKQQYMKHKAQGIPKYFRLEQLQDEFNFVSEEEMQKSKRFQLLQLRNAGQLDVFLLQQIPLYDQEIADSVFQEYESQIEKDIAISDVNSITAQRVQSAKFLKKIRRLIMKRIVKVSRFNLSDVVTDYEEIVSASHRSEDPA